MTVRPAPSSAAVSRRMRVTRRRDTPAELALRSELHRRGLRFRVDVSPIAKLRRRADIVFVRERVAVYVDGCFWHGCPEHGTWPKANADWWHAKLEANVKRDRSNDSELEDGGWVTVRVWEHEEVLEALQRVVSVLEIRKRKRRDQRIQTG